MRIAWYVLTSLRDLLLDKPPSPGSGIPAAGLVPPAMHSDEATSPIMPMRCCFRSMLFKCCKQSCGCQHTSNWVSAVRPLPCSSKKSPACNALRSQILTVGNPTCHGQREEGQHITATTTTSQPRRTVSIVASSCLCSASCTARAVPASAASVVNTWNTCR